MTTDGIHGSDRDWTFSMPHSLPRTNDTSFPCYCHWALLSSGLRALHRVISLNIHWAEHLAQICIFFRPSPLGFRQFDQHASAWNELTATLGRDARPMCALSKMPPSIATLATVRIAAKAQMPNYTTMVQGFLRTLQLPMSIQTFQGQCFTAPKMRFCSDLFLPKLAQLWQTAVLLQVQKAPQCPTATPSIIAKGPQQ
jgi:hypothetical protein